MKLLMFSIILLIQQTFIEHILCGGSCSWSLKISVNKLKKLSFMVFYILPEDTL